MVVLCVGMDKWYTKRNRKNQLKGPDAFDIWEIKWVWQCAYISISYSLTLAADFVIYFNDLSSIISGNSLKYLAVKTQLWNWNYAYDHINCFVTLNDGNR